jgi:hypothetical protein
LLPRGAADAKAIDCSQIRQYGTPLEEIKKELDGFKLRRE